MSGGTAGPTSFAAVSVPLPDGSVDPHLLAAAEGILFADGRTSLAGLGTAAVLDLPSGLEDPAALDGAQRWLGALSHGSRASWEGPAVRAFGALPFDRGAPGRLVVPEVTVGRDAVGRCWATVVAAGPAGPAPARLETLGAELAEATRRAAAGAPAPTDGAPSVVDLPPGEDYARAVETALERMAAGALRKVVLARSLEARFERPVTVAAVVGRLHDQEPSCTIFAFPDDADGFADGRFFGASPELLVRREGSHVTCHPLAGTVGLVPGRGAGAADEAAIRRFLASEKDRVEHRLVVEAIVDALAPRCSALSVPVSPSLVRLRTVAHLGTLVEGTLSGGADGGAPSVLQLLAELHPTPAVGGVPRAAALALISELEPAGRGRWAGPVGWVDAAGDGAWVIGIRSASVRGRTALLTAGAGIVPGSDPRAELEETTVKLAPLLEALSPGAGERR